MTKPTSKGPAMEESVRHYFLNLGYYVLRGVKFQYRTFDVTDVDLWLYSKPSALSRQRTNVDIKNRKTPQALERIFWTKGLKDVLRLDSCIVVTTDTRPEVQQFGKANQVLVLDGRFISRLQTSTRASIDRLSEEAFLEEVAQASMGKLGGDWRGLYEAAKTRILSSLDFDGCNAYLSDIHYFLEYVLSARRAERASLRIVYAITAMFLVATDFILKDHLSLDGTYRHRLLVEGFRYGESGKERAVQLARAVASLTEAAGAAPGIKELIITELRRQADNVPAELLAEFLAKPNVQGNLFAVALEFEASAYSPSVPTPAQLTPPAQGILAVLLDYFSIDRKRVLI